MQFGSYSVLDHGNQVVDAFGLLLTALRDQTAPLNWRIPAWLRDDPAVFLDRLLPLETLTCYQRYHDCGKPAARSLDEAGRVHYPNHAALSEAAWLAAGGDPQVGRLIGLDMAMHLAKAVDMPALAQLPEAASLYLTALAEVHANAEMFGGFESASFLGKAKHLDRRGKQLMHILEGTVAH